MTKLPVPAPAATAARQTHRGLVLAGLILTMFLAAMEATVVATAMPSVVAELHGIELYGWVTASYMLCSTLLMPLYGKLSDRLGRKPVLLGALLLFTLGSLACGLAESMLMLVLCRAIQGFGAGGVQPVVMTLVGDLYSPAERGRVQGYIGAVWGLAGTAGPLCGGLLVNALSWRWVFYINVPFALLAMLVLVFALHETVEQKPATRFDWFGTLLLSIGALAILLGASQTHPQWTLPLGALTLLVFVVWEHKVLDPLLSPALLKQRLVFVSCWISAAVGTLMIGTVTYLPLYGQAALGQSPTEAGMMIAPMLVGWPVAATVSGRLLPRFGYHPFVRTGAVLAALATFALYWAVRQGEAPLAIGVSMGALGAALGMTTSASVVAVQESVAWGARGMATSSLMFFRTVGSAVSVGAMGAVLVGALREHADPQVLDELLGPEHGHSLDPATLAQLAGDLSAGTTHVLLLCVLCALSAAVFGLFFPAMRPKPRT